MPLNLSPWQFQYGRSPAAQNITTPTWGPPDMSKQLQEGIANILPQLAKAYQGVNNQFQNEAAGREWMKAADAQQQQGPAAPGFEARRADQGEGPRAPLKAEYQTIADAKDDQYGLPKGYMSQLASTESSGDPNAISPTGARGLTQFTGGTWKTYGLGKNPMDPEANLDAGARYAVANRAELTAGLGREPTAGELYLAHQQGAGGALALLKNPDRPAAEVTAPKNILVNGGDMGITAGEFAKKWTSRFDGIGGPAGPQQGPGNGVAPGAMAAAGGAPAQGPGTQTAQQQPTSGGTAPVTANAPQVVSAAAPGVVTRSPPPEKAVASGSNQPPLFQTPEMAQATAGASGAQAPGQPQPGVQQPQPPQAQPQPQAVPPPPMPPPMVPEVDTTGAVPGQPAMPSPPPAGPPPLPNQPGPAAGNPAAAPPAPQPAAAGPAPAPTSRMPPAAPAQAQAAAVVNRMGLNPEAVAATSPHLMRALGHAIMANDPHMVAAITGGINSITAAQTAKGTGADFAIEHDARGNWFRLNKRTGEVEPLQGVGGGSTAPMADTVLQPGDPRRDQYTHPSDPRPWRLTQDDKGNIKPEPVAMNPAQEEAQKIGNALESTETYKKFKSSYAAVNAMEGALREGTNAGDFNATLQAFKVVDPGSTVTQNEQGAISVLGGASGILKNWISKLDANGGRLTEAMRAELYNAAMVQAKAAWEAGAKNDLNGARKKGLLIGRGDRDIADMATNFTPEPKFERRTPADFRNADTPPETPPVPERPPAAAGQPGSSAENPLTIQSMADLPSLPLGTHYRYPDDPPGKVRKM